ncbi:MAG: glutamate mutase L [Alistipes sp.]|nr:glutamate mutase L [Alistipes sp.]
MNYLTVDVGSTYTKLTAIDATHRRIVGTAQSFTTIESDVMQGFERALSLLREQAECRDFVWDEMLVCSSAAGGLKMVALGLVPDLTAKAARTAASNAGAKVVKTYAYEISRSEQQEIYDINPDLVLLCGGTDGGNREVITANARRLAAIDRPLTIIVAGNKSASDEIAATFEAAGKSFVITENVMPQFNQLNIEPARDAIRQLFIARIIEAKGLNRLQAMSPHKIIPTPLAVLQACELLSSGTAERAGWGDLMAVDIGGATTDVYSMAAGLPTTENTMLKGLPEPWAKRTVEGDLGMRYSLQHVYDQLPPAMPAEQEFRSMVEQWVKLCTTSPDTLAQPDTEQERAEEYLGEMAVRMAVERHAGRIADVYTPLGLMHTLEGKDLMAVQTVIGIGGVIRSSRHPREILKGCRYDVMNPASTRPREPRLMIDGKYIFASMGLLSVVERELAFELLDAHTTPLEV